MTSEWQRGHLGDFVTFVSGGTPSKDRPEFWGGSIPWVSAKDLKRLSLRDAEDHLTDIGVANGTRVAPAGTVFLLTRGMTLLKDVPIAIARRPMAFNQDLKACVPRPRGGVTQAYLPYLLLGLKPRLQGMVDLAGHGTGRLNTDELKDLDTLLPPEDQQRAIARILGELDDKIELNHRMGQTLEATARAVFKSWFLDFDPVRAKAEGRNPALPAHVADLFPDSLEDSELGEIPAGWSLEPLTALADLNPESWSDRDAPTQIDYVDLTGVKWGLIQEIDTILWDSAPSRARRIVRRGDTIVGTVRPGNGSYALVSAEHLTASTGFAALRPRDAMVAEYVYLAATAPENIERLATLADGAAYPAVRPDVVAATVVARPDPRLVTEFSHRVHPLMRRVADAWSESLTLAAVRDVLLPRLVSGELRIGDAARAAALDV
jgi:type I restriction enzyme S subunit